MKILINKKETCEYCEWGWVKTKVNTTRTGILTYRETFNWSACPMCGGKGITENPIVVEADEDRRQV